MSLISYEKKKSYQKYYRVDANYIDKMEYIGEKNRKMVVEWMLEVIQKFRLEIETFFLAVNYLDRYLSKHIDTKRSMLQGIAAVCLFIASKYEEIFHPDINDFIWISAQSFTVEESIETDAKILDTLNFRLMYITPLAYVNELTQHMSEQTGLNASYLCILATFNTYFLRYDASDIAAICIWVADKLVHKLPINDEESTQILKHLYETTTIRFSLYYYLSQLKKYDFVLKKVSPIKLTEFEKISKKKKISRPTLPKPDIK